MKKDAHHMCTICPECGRIKDNRAKVCYKCWSGSGNARRGTGRGWYVTSDGRKRIRILNHPYADKDSFVLEHRSIMEQYLKCYLEPQLFVHHLNGNTLDNRLENLAVCTNKEHIDIYHAENKEYLKLGRGKCHK